MSSFLVRDENTKQILIWKNVKKNDFPYKIKYSVNLLKTERNSAILNNR